MRIQTKTIAKFLLLSVTTISLTFTACSKKPYGRNGKKGGNTDLNQKANPKAIKKLKH
jgi:hypothetical protein